MSQQERDLAFQQYVDGLGRGDFDQILAALKQAETDVELEEMIERYHEVLTADMPPLSDEEWAILRKRINAIIDSTPTVANVHEQADHPIS